MEKNEAWKNVKFEIDGREIKGVKPFEYKENPSQVITEVSLYMKPDDFEEVSSELIKLHIGELLVFKELCLYGNSFSQKIELAKSIFTISKYTPISSEEIIRTLIEMPLKGFKASEAATEIRGLIELGKL
jgi:hypothetical protein